MIKKYEKYLEIISDKLQIFFEQQKPYIFCKEGCAICCETGEYPFSDVEFQYAMMGYNSLSAEEQEIIKNKVSEIKKLKENSTDKNFMYECPFLINKKCSIYNNRGVICRSYGLTNYTTNEEGETVYKMPCCVKDGLNYSNVYDKITKTISSEMYAATGIEQEPISYNIGLKFLLNNKMTKDLELEFGEQKSIIDWFL